MFHMFFQQLEGLTTYQLPHMYRCGADGPAVSWGGEVIIIKS